ncbi:MAG: helix-turn-helix transcriptional regulator [Calditrichae bacterium]|nr:helix-turn-helix transcriptional regulator [Calditrichia bacterium]
MTGFTAHEFIYDIRLKTAAQLLRESDETVTTIAIDTGFSSPGHLAKLFRKRFGMSPSVYRSVNTPT